MNFTCIHCETEMIKDCHIQVEKAMYGLKIKKNKSGFFNNISEKPKAAVCPDCGYVALYIDDFYKFK